MQAKVYSREEERQAWQQLQLIAEKVNVEEFWAAYARYLESRGLYSGRRCLLHSIILKTLEKLKS